MFIVNQNLVTCPCSIEASQNCCDSDEDPPPGESNCSQGLGHSVHEIDQEKSIAHLRALQPVYTELSPSARRLLKELTTLLS